MALPLSFYEPAAAGLGGIAGGSLGALGSALAPLDYPRQALLNAVRQPARYLRGEGSAQDLIGALPGLAGAAVAAPLIATGFGAPLGVGLGSLVAGIGQGLGRAYGGEMFNAPTTGELAEAAGIREKENPWVHALSSVGLGMMTDPLTFAGGLGGGAAGRGLKAAALARGPGYSDDFMKILRPGSGNPNAVRLMEQWGIGFPSEQEALKAVAREVPEGSALLGAGSEAMAFRAPQGGVVRVAKQGPFTDVSKATLDAPEVLRPAREALVGKYKVTHTPEVRTLGTLRQELGINMDQLSPVPMNTSPEARRLFHQNLPVYEQELQRFEQAGNELADRLFARRLNPWDLGGNVDNVALTPEGRWLTHDIGAVSVPQGVNAPRVPMIEARQPGRITNALLDLLGANQAVRSQIGHGVRSTRGQGISIPEL